MSSKYVVGAVVRRRVHTAPSFRKLRLFLGIVVPLLAAGGASAGTLSPSPTSVNFGKVALDTTASRGVTISNTGTSTITITGLSTSGPGFSASGPALPYAIAPGSSVKFKALFSPTSVGSVTGDMVLGDGNGTVLATVPLAGTGVHSAKLGWVASTSTVIGYYVYRSTTSGGPYTRVTASVVPRTYYTDLTVLAGTAYYYVITAVDASYNESPPTPQVEAVIPSP